MTKQQDIEQEFLTIEPLDNVRLDELYKKHKNFFDNGLPSNKDKQEKYLTMICEIGNSYSFSGRHDDAIKILSKVETMFKNLNVDNNSDSIYNSIFLSIASSNLELKNYLKALTYFKRYIPTGKEKDKIDELISFCKNKIKNKLALIAFILGLIILTIHYSIEWFSPDNYSLFIQRIGWFGTILMLTSGILSIKMKRKNNL